MQKLFNFLMVGLFFSLLNVATVIAVDSPAGLTPDTSNQIAPVEATSDKRPSSGGISGWIKGGLEALGIGKGPTEPAPALDSSAAPIGEGGEAGGPAATDSGVMINDGGHGANSGAENYAKSTEGDPYCVKLYTEGKIESVPLCVWKNEAWVLLKPEY